MSLNDSQRATTRAELATNLERSGATPEELAPSLDVTPAAVRSVLAVDDRADPALVWAVRDRIEQVVLERGLTPELYTFLSEGMRASAQRWFGVGDGPEGPPRPDRDQAGLPASARPSVGSSSPAAIAAARSAPPTHPAASRRATSAVTSGMTFSPNSRASSTRSS